MVNPKPAGPPRHRKFSLRLAFVMLVILLGCGYAVYAFYRSKQPYEWSGTVEARTISVGSRVAGRIKEVLTHEGETVNEGQALLRFEPGDLEAQKLSAVGQLNQAEANLERLEKGARPEEIEQAKARAVTASAAYQESRAGARQEEVEAARARWSAAQVAVDKAQLDANRARTLAASGSVSQAEVEYADAQLKGAMASRDAFKNNLEELEHGVRREQLEQAQGRAREAQANARLVESGSRVEDIKAARGQVEVAKGKLASIETMVDELTVKAPKKGRVEALDLRPGDIVAPNATVATLLEEDQLYVRIYVPETHLGQLRVGDVVPVTVDSFAHQRFSGVVEHINGVGEYTPRNLQTADERADQVFATRIGLRDGRDVLRAGMAAFITVAR